MGMLDMVQDIQEGIRRHEVAEFKSICRFVPLYIDILDSRSLDMVVTGLLGTAMGCYLEHYGTE